MNKPAFWKKTALGMCAWGSATGSVSALNRALEGSAKWADLTWVGVFLLLAASFWFFIDLIADTNRKENAE